MDCERRFPGLASLQKCAFDIYLALQVLGQHPETLSDGRPFVPSLLDTDLRGAQLGRSALGHRPPPRPATGAVAFARRVPLRGGRPAGHEDDG